VLVEGEAMTDGESAFEGIRPTELRRRPSLRIAVPLTGRRQGAIWIRAGVVSRLLGQRFLLGQAPK
jgi:hypothetical protein